MTAATLQAELADASRILAALGVNDAFGHVSARDPERADRFLMPRSMAPALVTPADVVQLDLHGETTGGGGGRLFLERFIHAEIYRVRPDVRAVVHSHSADVVPFTVVRGVRVRPICHVCGFLADTREPFEIADHAGPSSNLLVSDGRLGRALAQHLGAAAVVLMRGHGFTAVGDSVATATFRAFYTAKNCQIERAARMLGEPVFLSEGEARACEESTNAQAGRAWELWRRLHGVAAS